MANTITISLTRLRFFAYHGLYAEERKVGNEFEVNVSVSYIPSETVITELSHSINYVKLHELVKTGMQEQKDLLETFVMELAEKIRMAFPVVKKVEITIDKLYPPIAKFSGSVGVRYTKEY